MALEDFIDKFKEVEDARKLAKGMKETQGDRDAFKDFYEDFKKQAEPTYHDVVPQVNFDADEAIFSGEADHAIKFADNVYAGTLLDKFYDFAENNVEDIVKDMRDEREDQLLGLAVGLDAKSKKPAHKPIVEGIKKLKDAVKPLNEKNETAMENELNDFFEKQVGKGEEVKYHLAALKRFYRGKNLAIGYGSHIVRPIQNKLRENLFNGDYAGYFKESISELKLADRQKVYQTLYAIAKGKTGKDDD